MDPFNSEPTGDEHEHQPVIAPMHPGWIRWLPCSIELFRVVPTLEVFPIHWWENLDDGTGEDHWSQPAWCDPGDVQDWISSSLTEFGHLPEEEVRTQVLSAYEHSMSERTDRIRRLNDMCARLELPVPHTRRDLLEFLIELGLYRRGTEEDGTQWVIPQLYINPSDILPLGAEEFVEETSAQRSDYEELVVIGIRKHGGIEFDSDPYGEYSLDGPTQTVTTSINDIADEGDVSPGVTRGILMELADEEEITCDIDLVTVKFHEQFRVNISSELLLTYTNDWLAPPEHRLFS